jgi:ABC-type thiamine transport system ATPase subunit
VTTCRWALLVLAILAVVSGAGPVLETRQRAPEGIARAYLRAVEAGDLDAALATIDPLRRDELRERVAWQVRNRYAIVTLVLGQPSVVDRLAGRDLAPAWVTVLADVTTVAGERWRSTSTASLVERDGVWYLSRPLFA